MSQERMHPDDEWEKPIGDDPGQGGFLKGLLPSIYEGVIKTGDKFLRRGNHHLVTSIGDNKKEIPVKNLEVEEIDESQGEAEGISYRVRIMEGIGDHKKEIAVTTISILGLMAIIKKVHAKEKIEEIIKKK